MPRVLVVSHPLIFNIKISLKCMTTYVALFIVTHWSARLMIGWVLVWIAPTCSPIGIDVHTTTQPISLILKFLKVGGCDTEVSLGCKIKVTNKIFVLECIRSGQTGQFIVVNGETTRCMVMEHTQTKRATHGLGNSSMELDLVLFVK